MWTTLDKYAKRLVVAISTTYLSIYLSIYPIIQSKLIRVREDKPRLVRVYRAHGILYPQSYDPFSAYFPILDNYL